jgi:hypothetical protein
MADVSANIIPNPHGVQCGLCKEWFCKMDVKHEHKRDLPSDCTSCSACFRDNYEHALSDKHANQSGRCFVTGCVDEERYTLTKYDNLLSHIRYKHARASTSTS